MKTRTQFTVKDEDQVHGAHYAEAIVHQLENRIPGDYRAVYHPDMFPVTYDDAKVWLIEKRRKIPFFHKRIAAVVQRDPGQLSQRTDIYIHGKGISFEDVKDISEKLSPKKVISYKQAEAA